MTKTNDTLKNEKCLIHLNIAERSDINGRDLTDQHNDPAFYTKTVRGLKKAWEKLSEEFTEETTMYQAINILNEAGVRTHSWCMVD